jgi:hypothetical protein
MDEWYEGLQLQDKLRQALVWEDDENYEEFQQEKYTNELIFCLFRYLVLGGGMCQFDEQITEYLEATKLCYKDLVSVAKDADSGEIRPTSLVFRIGSIKGADYLKC